MIILISFLFLLFFLLETYCWVFRFIGNSINLPAFGYSLHSQFGTLSRIAPLLSMPIVGYMLDNHYDYSIFIHATLLISAIYIAILSFTLYKFNFFYSSSRKFFIFYIKNLYKIQIDDIRVTPANNLEDYSIKKSDLIISISTFFSFLIVFIGLFLSIILAALNYDNRAMFLQFSTFFTAIGTLIAIFFFDPRISLFLDRKQAHIDLLKSIFISRILAMITVFLISISYLIIFE